MAINPNTDEIAKKVCKRERVFRDRSNPLDDLDDHDIIERYRLSRHMIFSIIGKVSDRLEHQTQRSHAIPPYLNVLIALIYFSKGGFYSEIADIHGVSKSSVCRAIHATTDALCATMGDFVFPTMPSTQKNTKESFFDIAGFPKVLGAIDCTLVPIIAPKRDEVAYVCRKGYHALNIQAVCDANMRFTNCVFKWPGSVHDIYIWNTSALGQYFVKKNIDGWLLGDWICLQTMAADPGAQSQLERTGEIQ